MKYVAVVYCSNFNLFVSPFCDTPQEVTSWITKNNVDSDSIQPVINHEELMNIFGYLNKD